MKPIIRFHIFLNELIRMQVEETILTSNLTYILFKSHYIVL